ncbi:hypothetical protein [Actinomadura meridiana]|uniref:hypothetical protein n=1 Tax=Actinomadura meridiana TaxID=559626 RepID=UPI003CD05BD6
MRRVGAPYRLKPTELTNALLLTSGGISNVIKRLVDAGDGRSEEGVLIRRR